jgi:hypothetical protein
MAGEDLHIASDMPMIRGMQRKSFGDMPCPIARSLERVGEWWSMLILRDAFYGLTRFDEFQKSLDIAPNILTRRLNPHFPDDIEFSCTSWPNLS